MNDKIITEYFIVSKTELKRLEIAVINYIKDGFQPFGSPFATDRFYYQAIVKYAQKEKEPIQ